MNKKFILIINIFAIINLVYALGTNTSNTNGTSSGIEFFECEEKYFCESKEDIVNSCENNYEIYQLDKGICNIEGNIYCGRCIENKTDEILNNINKINNVANSTIKIDENNISYRIDIIQCDSGFWCGNKNILNQPCENLNFTYYEAENYCNSKQENYCYKCDLNSLPKKNKSKIVEDNNISKIICEDIKEPVCGQKLICGKFGCEIIKKTFQNKCEFEKNGKYKFLHEEECFVNLNCNELDLLKCGTNQEFCVPKYDYQKETLSTPESITFEQCLERIECEKFNKEKCNQNTDFCVSRYDKIKTFSSENHEFNSCTNRIYCELFDEDLCSEYSEQCETKYKAVGLSGDTQKFDNCINKEKIFTEN